MAVQHKYQDWSVTSEKVMEAVRRIVEAADPLQILLFGSRARGDHRPDSDIDIAVVIDGTEEDARTRLPHTVLRGIHMEVSLIVVSKAKYDLHRPWLNSVFNYIDREGVILYDRNDPQSTRPDALHISSGRRNNPAIPIA